MVRYLSTNSCRAYRKFFLYIKNDDGIPMTKGVGANNSCSAQLIHVGNNGITGNMYSNGYIIVTNEITDIDKAL